jgi:hypothetical protein
MQSQLFQGTLEQWNSVDMTHIIVALIVTAFLLLVSVAWARVALGSATAPFEKRSGRRWLLRPSNLLFVVGIVGVFYLSLGQPQIGPLNIRGYAGILILAFVLRYSENKAIGGWPGR